MKNFSYINFMKCNDWGRGKLVRKGKFSGRSGGVQGLWEHDMRLIDTPNANPKKLTENAIICKETEWKPTGLSAANIAKIGCDDPEFVAKRAKKLLEKYGVKPRPDSVKVASFILHVSPQYLRDGADDGKLNTDKIRKWAAGSIKYLQDTYGDRLISAMVHMDETNPHMSAYVVPLIKKMTKKAGRTAKGKPREETLKWCLSAKALFTPDDVTWKINEKNEEVLDKIEPGTCSLMQDVYAETLQRFGLAVRRGVKKPITRKGIKHEVNMDLYARRTVPVAHVKTLTHAELLEWAVIAAPAAEDSARAKKQRDYYQTSAADAQEKAKELEKKIAESQRKIPVEEVIQKLTGLEPTDPDDRPNGSDKPRKRKDIQLEFTMPNGMRLGIGKKNQFENLTRDIPFKGNHAKRYRGKGAIDAVMFLTNWTLQQTSEWIADNFSDAVASREIAALYETNLAKDRDDDERLTRKNHAKDLIRDLETADPSQWDSAIQTLTQAFKFRSDKIKTLHENNWIKANKHGHFVFQKVRWDDTNNLMPTGKIVVDKKNPTITLIETGDNGLFFEMDTDAQRAVICSSPMDALAIRSNPDHYTDTVVVVGKSPTNATKKAIERFLTVYGDRVILAENLTAAGRKLTAWIKVTFPQIATLPLPSGFKTWLDHHQRPRLHSDLADLRLVKFPNKNQDPRDDIAME